MGDGDYLDWNDRIVGNFFRPDFSGRTVHLYVNEDVIAQVAPPGGRVTDFVAQMKLGPAFAARGGICERALLTYYNWRARPELKLPPYVAYLALFVLAGGLEGEFAKHAYYPRLRKLLGMADGGMLREFDSMLALWDDLERWSLRDKGGSLGIFRVTRSGKWVHVGVPLGQTVLTEEERHNLPRAFSAAGLDPKSQISDEALAAALRSHGSGILSNKTVQRLAGQRDTEMFAVLIDACALELADWDGRLSTGADSRETSAPIRLCLSLDGVAGIARSVLRLKTSTPMPESALQLSAGVLGNVEVAEDVVGWSTPFADPSGKAIDAASIDWSRPYVARDDEAHWVARWPVEEVRILAPGARYGLPDLVEVSNLGDGHDLHVLFSASVEKAIEAWAQRSCEGFRNIHVTAGLPPNWRIAAADMVRPDPSVARRFPVLAGVQETRLHFVGGIRSAPGNSYFAFALPRVVLAGGEPGDRVVVNGAPLLPDESGQFAIPPSAASTDVLDVEVLRGGGAIRSHRLWIVRDFDWRSAARTAPRVDMQGRVTDASSNYIRGALLVCDDEGTCVAEWDPLLAPGMESAERVIVLGRRVGEISEWNSRVTPSWPPIWAVIPGEHPRFVFCAPPGVDREPDRAASPRARDVNAYRDLVWYRRLQVRVPRDRRVRRLLRRYQEVSRDA